MARKPCACERTKDELRSGKDVLARITDRDPRVRWACLSVLEFSVHGPLNRADARKACLRALGEPALFRGRVPCKAHRAEELAEQLFEALDAHAKHRDVARVVVPGHVARTFAHVDRAKDVTFRRLVKRPRPALYAMSELYRAVQQLHLLLRHFVDPVPVWFKRLAVASFRAHAPTDHQLWKLVEGLRAVVASHVYTGLLGEGAPLLDMLAALHDPRADGPGQRSLREVLRMHGRLPAAAPARAAGLRSPLPADVAGALALYDQLGLDGEALVRRPPARETRLKAFLRAHRRTPPPVRALLALTDGLGVQAEVGGIDDLPALQADLAAVLEDDRQRLREDGRPLTERTYRVRDLRRYLPLSRLFAVGRRPSGDIAFVNLSRPEGGKYPVWVTNHELLFGCDQLTQSYGQYVAEVVAQAWRNVAR